MNKEIIEYPFIRYPKILLDNTKFSQISIESKMLFVLILDRLCLSAINSEQFKDENGDLYVYYTLEEVCKKLKCSNTRTIRLFKELESDGLIIRKRKYRCEPYRIYITDKFYDLLKRELANLQNKSSSVHKIKTNEFTKCEDINTDNNNTYIINTQSSVSEAERAEEMVREQIEYHCIVHDGNRKLVDEIVMIITDVFTGTTPTVRVGRENMPRSAVVSRFRKLDSEHILYIISEIENNTSKIKNMKSYLITTLYNIPATMESTVAAEFAMHNRFN